jgi:hypothetical protein
MSWDAAALAGATIGALADPVRWVVVGPTGLIFARARTVAAAAVVMSWLFSVFIAVRNPYGLPVTWYPPNAITSGLIIGLSVFAVRRAITRPRQQ